MDANSRSMSTRSTIKVGTLTPPPRTAKARNLPTKHRQRANQIRKDTICRKYGIVVDTSNDDPNAKLDLFIQNARQKSDLDNDVTRQKADQVREVDDLCSICKREVKHCDLGLQCDKCDSWKHSRCLGITDECYEELTKSDEKFFCGECRMDMPVNPNVPSVNHQVADVSKAIWEIKGPRNHLCH